MATKTPAKWLIKSEPTAYAWSQLVEDGRTSWNGVRNFEARNHLRAMKVGDLALFYHSNVGKEVVGVARVVEGARPDPTAPGEDWSVVDFAPAYPLARAVTLAEIKAAPELGDILLVKRSRISVVPIRDDEFAAILKRGKTKAK